MIGVIVHALQSILMQLNVTIPRNILPSSCYILFLLCSSERGASSLLWWRAVILIIANEIREALFV